MITSHRCRQGVRVLRGAALALLCGLTACASKKADDSPVGVVKQFVDAARIDDTAERHKTMYKMLGPRTHARLQAAAQAATQATGGTQKIEPHQLLSASFRPNGKPDWEPKLTKLRLLDKTKTTARVAVEGDKGRRHVVTLVRVDGRWRIEFDPPAPTGATPL